MTAAGPERKVWRRPPLSAVIAFAADPDRAAAAAERHWTGMQQAFAP
jgi:hypothetical protein